jgi:hypothetical protein
VIGRCASCRHRRGEHDYPRPNTECRRCLCAAFVKPVWQWKALDQWLAEKVWRHRDQPLAWTGSVVPLPVRPGSVVERVPAVEVRASARVAAVPEPVQAAPLAEGGVEPGHCTGANPATAGSTARSATQVADPAEASAVMWDRLFLSRRVLSDLQAAVTRLEWSQAEVLTKLKELRKMTVVVAKPGDRGAALSELWQVRDLLAESDPDLAARLHAVYNALVVAHPGDAG